MHTVHGTARDCAARGGQAWRHAAGLDPLAVLAALLGQCLAQPLP